MKDWRGPIPGVASNRHIEVAMRRVHATESARISRVYQTLSNGGLRARNGVPQITGCESRGARSRIAVEHRPRKVCRQFLQILARRKVLCDAPRYSNNCET